MISDFGVAILLTSDHSRAEIVKAYGTAAYMAPEQLQGAVDCDGRGGRLRPRRARLPDAHRPFPHRRQRRAGSRPRTSRAARCRRSPLTPPTCPAGSRRSSTAASRAIRTVAGAAPPRSATGCIARGIEAGTLEADQPGVPRDARDVVRGLHVLLSLAEHAFSHACPCCPSVVPVYNEAQTVGNLLARCSTSRCPMGSSAKSSWWDDCSTDGTAKRLESEQDPRIRMFRQPVNQGMGAALRRGSRKCVATS